MGLSLLDLALVVLYLAAITAFGLRFRKRQHGLRDYFLADREIPWWAIALSIVAAETSTLTIISIPGLAYETDFAFLQLVFGYIAGRAVISFVLLPQYFRGELFTAYQFMERRFGQGLRRLTAGLFLITRAAAEGVRVFAVAIVVGIALGPLLAGFSDASRDLLSIGLVTLLTLLYTFEGGLAAVIWTDVVQLFIYIGGALVAAFTIIHLVHGGWTTIHLTAANAGKFRVLYLSLDLYRTYTFWSGFIGGTFLTMASHGTDQLIVQRLLAARNESQSKLALLSSGIIVLIQFWLFLLIGAMLWVFYRFHPPATSFGSTDRIFPTFIVSQMPHGVAGILIAAILAAAMSNLSAALNALSSTSIVDFYLRRHPTLSDSRRLLVSRIATLFWGAVLFALAILSRRGGKVVEVGLSIASVAYGALLGVFLLGVLTRRANERGGMIGMAAGFLTNLYIWQGRSFLETLQRATGFPFSYLALTQPIPFTWYVLLGSLVTFVIGYSASLLFDDPHMQQVTDKATQAPSLSRDLGVSHATAVVIGTIIGSGIFLVPAEMMQAVGSARLVYLVWIVGGLLSMFGAMTYAELGAMKPQAGGEYIYIRDAYGPLPAFLYAWTWFAIAKPASVATTTTGLVRILGTFHAFAFFNHAAILSPLTITYGQFIAILAATLITALNYIGIKKAGEFQLVFTVLKIVMIVAIAAMCFTAASGTWSNFATEFTGATGGLAGFFAALVAALWAYDGWNDLNMVSGEVRHPERNIPIGLLAGVSIVAVLYMLTNAAVQYVLPAARIAASERPASEATAIAVGAWGAGIVSAGMALSMLVSLNGTIMSGARVPYAMARDGYFFRALADVHPRFHTPSGALIVQLVLSVFLLLFAGNFRQLFSLAIFAEWLFYMIAASTVFVLRKKEPGLPRPYHTWGYPVVPALFVLAAAVLLYFTFTSNLRNSAWGCVVILAGVPIFWYFARARRTSPQKHRVHGEFH